jgi:hypothetical protein
MKKHWRMFRQNKRIFWSAISVVLVLLIIAAAYVYINVSYAIGEDLVIKLAPEDKSLYLSNGESSTLKFDVSIETSSLCRTSCSYTLVDKSAGIMIDNGTSYGRFSRNYTFTAQRFGEGQKIYNLEISCSNTRSQVCPSDGKKRFKTGFILLNYNNSRETAKAREDGRALLGQSLAGLDKINKGLQSQAYQIFELERNIFLDDIKRLDGQNNAYYAELENQIDAAKKLWGDEDYIGVRDEIRFFNPDKLNKSIQLTKSMLFDRMNTHNDLIDKLKMLIGKESLINNAAALTNSTITDKTVFIINKAISTINAIEGLSSYSVAAILIDDANEKISLMNSTAWIRMQKAIDLAEDGKAIEAAKLSLAYGRKSKISINKTFPYVDLK